MTSWVGRFLAARVLDLHACVPDPSTNTIVAGLSTVLIGLFPAAGISDKA